LTDAEKKELDAWRGRHKGNNLLFQQLTNMEVLIGELKKIYEADREAGWQRVLQKITSPGNGI
jgi:hypothetical protein